jgi:hypothetical protein
MRVPRLRSSPSFFHPSNEPAHVASAGEMGELWNAAPRILGFGRAFLPSSIIGFFHGAFQPHLDQMQHVPINDPACYRFQQLGMGDAPEGSGHRLPITAIFPTR